MTKTLKDVEMSERLRELIENRFGQRGRFRLLEEASGVPEWKWKNFFYRRQEAGQDQIQFWVAHYPSDELWLLKGIRPSERDSFPFCNEPPTALGDSTVSARLNWVIEEFASPRGEQLFSYLENRYKRRVTAEAWKQVILQQAEPTVEMVALICSDRPMFAQWVLLGHVTDMSVDPADSSSVQRWVERRKNQMGDILATEEKED